MEERERNWMEREEREESRDAGELSLKGWKVNAEKGNANSEVNGGDT